MTEERFNQEQVLSVLAQVWPRRNRGLHNKSLASLSLRKWGDWDWSWGEDFLDFRFACRDIEDIFGFKTAETDWLTLATDKAMVGDLADFIAARAPRRSIHPVNILGRKCDKAGIFRMLEETTQELAGDSVRVGPSTRLAEVLNKDQIEKLTRRAQLHFPYIRSAEGLWYRSWLSGFVGVCLVVIFTLTAINIETGFRMSEGFSFSTELGYWAGFLAFLLILGMPVILLGLLTARWALRMNTGPLDGKIKTYRDLVNVLDRQKQNAFE